MNRKRDFDFQPTLRGDKIIVRPLCENDYAALRLAASDPMIWAGHPVKDRCKAKVFRPYFDKLLGSQRALVVLEQTGRVIGTSSYYTAPDGRNDVSIGFTFLTCDHWGGRTNIDLKRLMLGHAFATRDVVWFHIDPVNVRSQTATLRLGAVFVEDAKLDLGAGPVIWKCYRIDKTSWQNFIRKKS